MTFFPLSTSYLIYYKIPHYFLLFLLVTVDPTYGIFFQKGVLRRLESFYPTKEKKCSEIAIEYFQRRILKVYAKAKVLVFKNTFSNIDNSDIYILYFSRTLRNLVLFLFQMLFLRINASYKLHLKKQLSHLNVINDGGPQNGYVFFFNIFTIYSHIELF